MKFKIFFLLCFALFSLSKCTGSKSILPIFIDDPITRVNVERLISKANRFPQTSPYGVLIILEKVIYRLEKNNKVTLQVHQITKILEDHKQGMGKSFIYYRSGYEKITKIEAFTITKTGQRVDATNIRTNTPFYNQFLQLDIYKDIKVKTITLPRVEKGSILNLRYQLETDFSELQGVIEGEFFLANRFPILKQKGIIIVPKGRKIWFKKVKTDLTPKKISTKKNDYFIIEQDKIPIIAEEPFQPPFQEISPKIVFSTLKNWNELNKKLYPMLSAGLVKEKKVIKFAKDLTAGIDSKERKAEILYNYVTNPKNIANVAIPFGMGGYIPSSSSIIIQKRYGDSKDKAILLANLLNSVGIESKIALTNESYSFDPEVPSIKSLNRILVAIKLNDKYQFLDPHSAIVRYGYLPGSNYGKRLIILDPKKAKMTQIPNITSNKNRILYDTKSEINSNGTLKYTTGFKPTGSYEINERANMIKIMLKNKYKSLMYNYKKVYEKLPKIKLLKLDSPNPFDIENGFEYKVAFQIKKFPIKKNNLLMIQPELHHRKLSSFSRHRVYDLDFSLPFKVISKNEIRFPKNWKIKKLPKTVKINEKNWNYIREIKVGKNKLKYKRILEVKKSRIKRNNYIQFKNFIDKVIQSDKQLVSFTVGKMNKPDHKIDLKNN